MAHTRSVIFDLHCTYSDPGDQASSTNRLNNYYYSLTLLPESYQNFTNCICVDNKSWPRNTLQIRTMWPRTKWVMQLIGKVCGSRHVIQRLRHSVHFKSHLDRKLFMGNWILSLFNFSACPYRLGQIANCPLSSPLWLLSGLATDRITYASANKSIEATQTSSAIAPPILCAGYLFLLGSCCPDLAPKYPSV